MFGKTISLTLERDLSRIRCVELYVRFSLLLSLQLGWNALFPFCLYGSLDSVDWSVLRATLIATEVLWIRHAMGVVERYVLEVEECEIAVKIVPYGLLSPL